MCMYIYIYIYVYLFTHIITYKRRAPSFDSEASAVWSCSARPVPRAIYMLDASTHAIIIGISRCPLCTLPPYKFICPYLAKCLYT